jgi:CHAT domain-containing protein
MIDMRAPKLTKVFLLLFLQKKKAFFFVKKKQKTFASLALVAAIAGCATPPPEAYYTAVGNDGAPSVALGNNAAGEPCTESEISPGREYALYCGTWKQPSARLTKGPAATEAELTALATTSRWRQGLDSNLDCGAPTQSTILGGPALLLRCSRRLEGFPQTAFVVLLDGHAWFADGVPPASPVLERAVALNSGRITAASLGSVVESPGLAAERLASRGGSADDLATYQSLLRTAVRANLAGEFAAAEAAYRSMAEIQRKSLDADNPALARAYALEALQISNQGRFPEAKELLDRAAILAARGGDATGLAQVHHYQGLNLLNQKRPKEALVLLQKAESEFLPVAPDSNERANPGTDIIPTDQTTHAAAYGVVETRRAQAVAYRMLGDNAAAARLAQSAETVLAAYDLRSLKTSARLARTKAQADLAGGESGAALGTLQKAVESFGKSLPGTRAFGETQLLLAARLSQTGDTAGAQANCRAAGHVLRAANAGVSADRLAPCLALLAKAAEGGDQDAGREMFLLAQQAQGGTTSQQIALVSARLAEGARDPRVAKLIRERDDNNAELAHLYSQRDDEGEKPLPETTKAIAADEAKRDSLEQAMQSASPNYGQLVQQAVSADDILHALRPGEVFSGILLARDTGYNFIFYDGRITVTTIAGGAAKVDKLVARIRSSVDAQTADLPPFDTDASATLYTALYGGAADTMAHATSLSVAPAGTLLSIPFGLLLTEKIDAAHLVDAQWLVRKMVIAHVPAPANFVTLRKVAGTSRATKPWFGFGDFRPVTEAQAEASFPPATCADSAQLFAQLQLLPGAAKELNRARAQLGASEGDELLGPDFTAAAVQAASLKDYRMLHFATHGLLQTDLACQGEPALVTSAPAGAKDASGALLTASEIAGLKLDADAVLLSACNTGGGGGGSAAGEGLSGLARSFFYAGARSMLVTHWDVNDQVTSVLVATTLAYAQNDPNLGIAASLAAAQRKLLDKAKTNLPNLAHPFFWAPVALIGEGRSVHMTAVSGL